MKNRTLLLLTATVMLLSVNFCVVQAQDRVQKFTIQHEIRFALYPFLYDNLTFTNYGKKHLASKPTISGEATLSYYKHIYKGYGVCLGAGVGVLPYNLNYNFKAPENSVFHDYGELTLNSNDYYSRTYVLPMALSKTFWLKNTLFSVDIGAKLHFLLDKKFGLEWDAIYEIDENNPDTHLFHLRIDDTGKNALMSYFVKLGIIKMTKRKNAWHFNVVANYSPDKVAIGWYTFYHLGYDSYGKVEQNLNYIGVEVAYGLNMSKKTKK